jgi:hypothetical protein
MNELKYYLVQVPGGDQYPYLKMDKDSRATLEKGFQIGVSQPLTFKNAWREDNIEEGISEIIGEVLFSGNQILISDRIKNDLLNWGHKQQEAIPADFFPAIYIDDNDVSHENYWFVNLENYIDCWHRETSNYRTTPTDDQPVYDVKQFSLDREKLKQVKNQGLLFKIGNNVKPPLVLREEISVYFDLPEVQLIEL